MLCTEIVSDNQNNFCSPHVLQKEELLTKIYLYQYSYFVQSELDHKIRYIDILIHIFHYLFYHNNFIAIFKELCLFPEDWKSIDATYS